MSAARTRPAALVAVVGLVAPVLAAIAGVVVMVVALPTLPAEVVINHGGGATGPAWTYPVVLGLLGVGIPVLLHVLGSRGRAVGDTAVVLAAVGFGTGLLLAVGMTWTLLIQPDGDAALPILIAAATAIGLAATAWIVLPRDPATPTTRSAAPPLARPAGTRTVWSTTARSSTGVVVGVGLAVALASAAVVIAVLVSGPALWPLALVPLVLVLLVAATTTWRVSAGPAGLVVRAALGWPAFRVPAGDIAEVAVVDVDPMTDFGGWGMRLGLTRVGGRRRFGIVVRAGEAIEAVRRDGRVLVVTVDGAAAGAAVLARAAEDARAADGA